MSLLLAANELQLGSISMYLFGGLAIFLYGMEQMTDALKIVAGDRMKNLLARLTTNRFKGAFAGAFVTSVIQSSSVTTVLVVGFISAGLMNLTQSVPVIMGANIGTTITAQIIAFKVTHYALVLVAAGFSLLFFTKNERLQHYGHMTMGLGLIFFGMEMMSTATHPLREYEPFHEFMASMENPLLGILVGAAFTAVIQSSSATTGIIILLARDGLSLEAGIALAMGANIGTCVTAQLSAIGKPRAAVRAACIHVLFNAAGVLIWIAFINQLAWVVRGFSDDTPRQIANAHTIFNVVNTLIFIPFVKTFASIAERLVPDRPREEPEIIRPRYLDDILVQTPAMALDLVRMELGRLGACAYRMVRETLTPVIRGTRGDLRSLEKLDEDVDRLHAALITFLGRLSQENLSTRQSQRLHVYMTAANYLESIGDLIETNIVEAGLERLNHNIQISGSTEGIFKGLHEKVAWATRTAVQSLVEADVEKALGVVSAKEEVNRLAEEAEVHLSRRLTAAAPNRLAAFRIESELVEYFKRVYYFAKRIAKIAAAESQPTAIRAEVDEPQVQEEREALV